MTTKLFQKRQFVLVHGIVAAVALMFCLMAFVGCGSNSGEGTNIFSNANAAQQTGAGVERWEYKAEFFESANCRLRGIPTIQEKLNELGAQGWELVATHSLSVSHVTLYLKRRLP